MYLKTILHSDVPCEFKLITGAMQTQMTLNNNSMEADNDPMTTLLSMAIVKLGEKQPTREDVENMLVTDRNLLLLQLRLASYGETFEFPMTWEVGGEKETIMHSIDLQLNSFECKTGQTEYTNFDTDNIFLYLCLLIYYFL